MCCCVASRGAKDLLKALIDRLSRIQVHRVKFSRAATVFAGRSTLLTTHRIFVLAARFLGRVARSRVRSAACGIIAARLAQRLAFLARPVLTGNCAVSNFIPGNGQRVERERERKSERKKNRRVYVVMRTKRSVLVVGEVRGGRGNTRSRSSYVES